MSRMPEARPAGWWLTFWIEDPERAYWCHGHGGQDIYTDLQSDFTAVKFSYGQTRGTEGDGA